MSVNLNAIPLHGGSIRGQLTLQPGSVATDNEYGTDILVRSFFAFTDEVYQLVPQRGEADMWLASMRVTDRTITEGRGTTALATVTYKGLVDDKLPPPTIKGGFSEVTTQLSTIIGRGDYATNGLLDLGLGNYGGGTGVDGVNNKTIISLPYFAQQQEIAFESTLAKLADEEAGEVAVTYNSPFTTYFYVVRKNPKVPKYWPRLEMQSDADFEVSDIQPASFTGRPVCNKEVRLKKFEKSKVGSFYEVMEQVQGELANLKVVMRGIKGTFGGGKPVSVHNQR